jgi:hypothetical protein
MRGHPKLIGNAQPLCQHIVGVAFGIRVIAVHQQPENRLSMRLQPFVQVRGQDGRTMPQTPLIGRVWGQFDPGPPKRG